MKKNTNVSIRLIESAYKSKFKYLFSCAYLITGNERTAESILMKEMLSHPMPEEKDFEAILENIKYNSIKSVSKEDAALFSFSGDMTGIASPLSEWILTLDEKKARTIVLRYALDLSVKEISAVTGDSAEKIKAILERAKVRAFSQIKGRKGGKSSSSLIRQAASEVIESACFPPDFNALLRSIERIIEDKNASSQRSFSVKPVISWLITAILMVFITLVIWMSVVLIDYLRVPKNVSGNTVPVYNQSPTNTEG